MTTLPGSFGSPDSTHPRGMARPALNVWLVTDRTPGHVSQLAGLAAGLAEQMFVCERWIDDPFAPPGGTASGGATPDLILCCGRRTHRPALALQQRFGGRSVVLMRPSRPWLRFDLAVVPAHDRPRPSAGTVITQGALNTLRPSGGDPAQGVILVGGPSRHVAWNDAAVLHQIDRLVADTHAEGIAWRLTTSRRTPESLLLPLIERQHERLRVIPCEQTPPDWVASQLARAGHAAVTGDSVSMVCEAATAGCTTTVLEVPPVRRRSRVHEGVRQLVEAGHITTLDRRDGFVPQQSLREADRVAEHIITNWFTTPRRAAA